MINRWRIDPSSCLDACWVDDIEPKEPPSHDSDIAIACRLTNQYMNVKCLLAVISWLNSCIAVLFISYSQAVDISFVRCLLAIKCIYACYQMYLCLLSNVDLLAVKYGFACYQM